MGNYSDFEIENGILIKYWGYEEYVTVPDDVIRIGADAFRGCDTIKNVICDQDRSRCIPRV